MALIIEGVLSIQAGRESYGNQKKRLEPLEMIGKKIRQHKKVTF